MTNDEREILIRIDQKVTDMHEKCDRHSGEIRDLYKRTDTNARNIAKIAGGVVAATTLITIIISIFK